LRIAKIAKSEKRRLRLNRSVAKLTTKPKYSPRRHGDTEKSRGKNKVKSKYKIKIREQPRTQRIAKKIPGEWKSLKIFGKGKIFKVSNTEEH